MIKHISVIVEVNSIKLFRYCVRIVTCVVVLSIILLNQHNALSEECNPRSKFKVKPISAVLNWFRPVKVARAELSLERFNETLSFLYKRLESHETNDILTKSEVQQLEEIINNTETSLQRLSKTLTTMKQRQLALLLAAIELQEQELQQLRAKEKEKVMSYLGQLVGQAEVTTAENEDINDSQEQSRTASLERVEPIKSEIEELGFVK